MASPSTAATIILDGTGFRIPPAGDGTGPGDSTSTVTASGTGLGRITSIVLTLTDLRHTEVGDLQFLLSHRGTEVNFANFFGARMDDDNDSDEADLNGTYRIFDAATRVFQTAPGDPIPSGDYRPTVRDRLASDSGRLGSFRLEIGTDAPGAVPEPATWAMMIGGFGMIGGTMRRRKTRTAIRFA